MTVLPAKGVLPVAIAGWHFPGSDIGHIPDLGWWEYFDCTQHSRLLQYYIV
jgi:hypothetical protein